METINDRMQTLVNERFNGNKAAFAKVIGMPPTSMSSYLGTKRRSKPSVDMVVRIINELGVDAKWLLTGEEPSVAFSSVVTQGDFSPASIHDDVSVGNDVLLAERIKSLEALLAEKERLIKVLLERK